MARRTTTKRNPRTGRTAEQDAFAHERLAQDPVPETLEERCLRLEGLNGTLLKQRDDALASLNRQANSALLLARYDDLLQKVEKGMTRLRRTLRVIVDVAED